MPSFRLAGPLAAGPLLALALAGCGRKPPPPAPPPPEVGYVVVQAQPVRLTTELPGRVNAYITADVRPQVNGIITARLFTEGTDVKAGQPLYLIDPKPYQATLAQAQAQAANAQANLTTTRLQAQRYADLVKINAVSRQDNDNAQAAYQQARATVQQQAAAVQAARINLGYTRITAPVSGRIGRSLVTIGSLATSGQATALATIQALDPVYVDVTQSADELLKLKSAVKEGQVSGGGPQSARATLILSDGQHYADAGVIRFSEAQVDPTTGSVTLRTVFPNANRTLLPGMYVREEIEQAVDRDGVLVPQTAITRDPTGKATAMLAVNGAAQVRPVTVDRTIGDQWLITSGLNPGDQLITIGASRVQAPGTKVRAVPAAQMAADTRPPPPGAGPQGAGRQGGAGSRSGAASGVGGAHGTPSSASR